MNFQLFKISESIEKVIEEGLDIETGEISEKSSKALEALQMDRLKVIENMALYIKNKQAELSALQEHKDSIEQRIAQRRRSIDWLTRFLGRSVIEGEQFSTPEVELKWTTSNRLEIDDIVCDPEKFLKDKVFKKFLNIKTTIEWSKKELMDYLKSGKQLPVGMNHVTTKNLKVK